MARRIGVLMGGWGEEREISIKTGEAVATALESRGHCVQRVLAGPELDRALRSAQIDVAFVALHGRMGEDGRVQGLLEVLGVPYTGSGVLASAIAMDKVVTKRLLAHANLPMATGYAVKPGDDLETAHGDHGFPCVVKPSRGGSSVGVFVARRSEELSDAVHEAARYGGVALVERRVIGQEITVGILGDRVLGSCEMAFGSDTFDYATKYQTGVTYFLPPRLSVARRANIEAIALAAYREVGCRGYARVDFIASETENDVLLEINTLPGMTSMSLLPRIAKQAGLSYEDLCEAILASATLDGAAVAPARPPIQSFEHKELAAFST